MGNSGKLQKINLFYLGIIVSIAFWFVESGIDTYIFGEGTYWERLVAPDPNEAWMRFFIGITIVCFGLFAEKTLNKEVIAHKRSEETKNLILQAGSDAFIQCNHDGIIIGWNKTAALLFGWTKEEILGKPLMETLIPFHNDGTPRKAPGCFLKTDWSFFNKRLEIQAQHRNGEFFQAEMTVSYLRTGETYLFNVLLHDITEKKISEEKLRLAAVVFKNVSEAVVITNARGKISAVNPAFTQVTGYSLEEVVEKNPSIMSSGKHHKSFYTAMWNTINATGFWKGEIWDRKKNGTTYPKWLSITAVKDAKGEVEHYIGLFTDITRRKKEDEAIYYRAHYDTLTGLANRDLFHQRLSDALTVSGKCNKKVAVLFVDLDHFKDVNDTLGHAVGDEVLKMAADRLGSCIRGNDTLARTGGDEFLIVLPDIVNHQQIVIVAKRIIDKFSRIFHVDGDDAIIGISIGISIFPEDGSEAKMLIQTADLMMYQAKTSGGNDYLFSPTSN